MTPDPSTVSPEAGEAKPFRVKFNAKIDKWQIMLPDYNVAVAEFYDNTNDSREEIAKVLQKQPEPPAIQMSAEAVEKIRDALNLALGTLLDNFEA